ncbi:MAG TPA: alpha/beta hydrolase, partial [Pseudonocardiaceae bacterium]|nr:alpha/beta hydrolase [Pseudonocardiaceae bacterium]
MQAPEYTSSMLVQAEVIAVGNPAEISAIRLNWRTSNPNHLAILQAALLADGTRDELLAYLHFQEPDEALVVDEVATRANAATWGRIPRTYLRLAEDR